MNLKFRENIAEYSYYGMMGFLPLSVFIDNIALFLLLFFGLLNNKILIRKKQLFFGSLILFFLYNILSGIFSGYFSIEIANYIKLLPLLLIPLAMSSLQDKVKEKGLFFLFAAIVLIQLIAVYGILEYYFFAEGRKLALRSYSGINEILMFERPYLAYFSSISILIGYFFVKKSSLWIFLASTLISIVLIIIISARLAMIILIISATLILFFEIKNRILKFVVFVFVPLAVVFLISLSNTPLKHRFLQSKHDTRTIIWEGAMKIIKKKSNYVFGSSSQNKIRQELVEYYRNEANFEYKPDKQRFLSKKYNSHNQYINELLRGGGLGLFFLIYPFIYLGFINFNKGNLFYALLIISVLLLFTVENLLERQMGVYVIAIILSISNKFKK